MVDYLEMSVLFAVYCLGFVFFQVCWCLCLLFMDSGIELRRRDYPKPRSSLLVDLIEDLVCVVEGSSDEEVGLEAAIFPKGYCAWSIVSRAKLGGCRMILTRAMSRTYLA